LYEELFEDATADEFFGIGAFRGSGDVAAGAFFGTGAFCGLEGVAAGVFFGTGAFCGSGHGVAGTFFGTGAFRGLGDVAAGAFFGIDFSAVGTAEAFGSFDAAEAFFAFFGFFICFDPDCEGCFAFGAVAGLGGEAGVDFPTAASTDGEGIRCDDLVIARSPFNSERRNIGSAASESGSESEGVTAVEFFAFGFESNRPDFACFELELDDLLPLLFLAGMERSDFGKEALLIEASAWLARTGDAAGAGDGGHVRRSKGSDELVTGGDRSFLDLCGAPDVASPCLAALGDALIGEPDPVIVD